MAKVGKWAKFKILNFFDAFLKRKMRVSYLRGKQMEFTTKELASLFNVSHRSIRAWATRGMPKKAPGRFEGLPAIKWYAENIFMPEAAESKDLLSKAEAERLMLNLKAELLQVQVDAEKGKLVEVEKVKRDWGEVATASKAMLLNIPYRLSAIVATMTDEREIRNALKTEIRSQLFAFADGKCECKHCGGSLWNPNDEDKV
jgi:phage terminase Nu1 subunit (DNA packaging protein)